MASDMINVGDEGDVGRKSLILRRTIASFQETFTVIEKVYSLNY